MSLAARCSALASAASLNLAFAKLAYAEVPSELSANNADSTLRIVKEQQPTLSSPRLANLNSNLLPAEVCQPFRSELVEDDGIEPTTPCLQSRCSPS